MTPKQYRAAKDEINASKHILALPNISKDQVRHDRQNENSQHSRKRTPSALALNCYLNIPKCTCHVTNPDYSTLHANISISRANLSRGSDFVFCMQSPFELRLRIRFRLIIFNNLSQVSSCVLCVSW